MLGDPAVGDSERFGRPPELQLHGRGVVKQRRVGRAFEPRDEGVASFGELALSVVEDADSEMHLRQLRRQPEHLTIASNRFVDASRAAMAFGLFEQRPNDLRRVLLRRGGRREHYQQ